MAFSGMLRRVALVRTEASEELGVSFIGVTEIGELGTTISVTLMKEALNSPKHRFLQEPHDVTSQKTPFSILHSHRRENLKSYKT
jgi:hypothetical protein